MDPRFERVIVQSFDVYDEDMWEKEIRDGERWSKIRTIHFNGVEFCLDLRYEVSVLQNADVVSPEAQVFISIEPNGFFSTNDAEELKYSVFYSAEAPPGRAKRSGIRQLELGDPFSFVEDNYKVRLIYFDVLDVVTMALIFLPCRMWLIVMGEFGSN